MYANQVKKNLKVRLPANAEEGWPEEFGVILDDTITNGTILVEIYGEYLQDECDDGIRETLLENVEVCHG